MSLFSIVFLDLKHSSGKQTDLTQHQITISVFFPGHGLKNDIWRIRGIFELNLILNRIDKLIHDFNSISLKEASVHTFTRPWKAEPNMARVFIISSGFLWQARFYRLRKCLPSLFLFPFFLDFPDSLYFLQFFDILDLFEPPLFLEPPWLLLDLPHLILQLRLLQLLSLQLTQPSRFVHRVSSRSICSCSNQSSILEILLTHEFRVLLGHILE